ncbi:sialidase family protein [Streptomyces sp. CA-100214]
MILRLYHLLRRARTRAALCLMTGVLGLSLAVPATAGTPQVSGRSPAASPAATGTPLRDGTGLYPRAVRLGHNGAANGRVLASVVTFDGNNGVGAIHESTDQGASFREVGRVVDPDSAAGQGLCCATLFELPRQVGGLRAGTLLWASSAGQDEQDRRMALRIWRSDDVGRTWSYLSSCAVAGGTGGLWEPEFSVAADGALVCHYSDETDPGTVRSWSPRAATTASTGRATTTPWRAACQRTGRACRWCGNCPTAATS